MPKRIVPLTDTMIKKATPKGKPKLMDGYGLYVLVTPTGGKLWRYDYRFGGRRKTLALGTYPEYLLQTRDSGATTPGNFSPITLTLVS